jgi:hypothetical protein
MKLLVCSIHVRIVEDQQDLALEINHVAAELEKFLVVQARLFVVQLVAFVFHSRLLGLLYKNSEQQGRAVLDSTVRVALDLLLVFFMRCVTALL